MQKLLITLWALVALSALGADDIHFANDTTCTVHARFIWWNDAACPGSSVSHYVDWDVPPYTTGTMGQSDGFGGYCGTIGPQPGHTGTAQCMNYSTHGTINFSSLNIDGCNVSTNPPSYTTNCWHASVFNATGSDKDYVVMGNFHTNGGYFVTVPSLTRFVPRGTSYTWDVCEVNTNGATPTQYRVLVEDPITGEVMTTYDGQNQTNGGSYSSAINTNADLYPASITLYAGGTNSIPGASVGDNAIYNAVRDMDQHLQHLGLSNSVSVVNSNYNANYNTNFNFNTNLTSVTITNPINITQTNWLDPNLSNLLAQVRHNQTNMGGLMGQMNYITNIFSATNGTLATARAVDALGDALTSAESVASAVQGGPPVDAGGGASDGLTFMFCGVSICLDPATIFPGLTDAFRLVFSWLMIVGMLMWMGKEYMAMAIAMGQTKMGGLPDADSDVPVLGNWAGVAVALFIPVVYLGLWLTLWHFIFGADFNLLSLIGQAKANNPFYHIGISSSTALYLINEFFDLQLCLALLWARLTWYYVGGKIVMVLMSASRMLVGE